MSDRKTYRLPLRLDAAEHAAIQARADELGVRVTPYVRDAALNPAIETAAERRRAVSVLFGIRRELAGMVLLSRDRLPAEEAAEMKARLWALAERIDRTIDNLAERGIAS